MVDGRALTFEVFGLWEGVLSMIDRETGTMWTHLDGKALVGPLEGARMTIVPMPVMTWGEWKALYPETKVLSQDTSFSDLYRPVEFGVFDSSEASFGDDRLASNALVVGVEANGDFKGYPLEELEGVDGVVNDTLAGQPILVFYDAVAQTGLAYSREVDGQVLEFRNAAQGDFELRDLATGSVWNSQGKAVSGALAGKALQFVPSFISEWYGWSGYHAETTLYEAPS